MSDIGLNANIYQVTKKYLDVLNNFLLNYKLNQSTINLNLQEDIAFFLEQLKDESNRDPHMQMLHVLVDRSLRLKQKSIETITSRVITSIRNKTISTDTIDQLEVITKILDTECLKAISRTKGTRR